MATYVIGDIQGCFSPLISLLEQIHFQPDQDELWFAGDLVNRGPESLEALRFIKSLGPKAKVVLGNHDLHLLATAYGHSHLKKSDTLGPILQAADRDELMDWLRHQPLSYYSAEHKTLMTHAGIPPCWNLEQVQALAGEVEQILQSDQIDTFLSNMYGNKPDIWSDDLAGQDRLRAITNYLTRMRFCAPDSRLDLKSKEGPTTAIAGYAPWFFYPNKLEEGCRVVFGHWAALEGHTPLKDIHALDTGCVWGGALTALRLEDEQRFTTSCKL